MSQPSTSLSVSQTPATTTSSDIERIFDAALKSYKKKTKKDLKSHDLFKQLETCDSPAAILAVFQTAQFDTGNDDRLKRWLVPTLNVLCSFSDTLGEGVSLAFPPAKAVFAGVGVLLSAAKDVTESQDILIDIFGRIESFFVRLEIYTEVSLTPAMTDKMVQITVEILDVIATATKEIKRSAAKKFLKRVIGQTDLEDGMKKLDKLTSEEVAMASAQLLKVAHNIDSNVTEANEGVRRVDENVLVVKSEVLLVNDNVKAVDGKVQTMADDCRATATEVKLILRRTADGVDDVNRKQLLESLRKWQSPPDPSTNHHIASDRQHDGTAEWFIDSEKFCEWMAAGALLWIHGKAGSGKSILCSAIINNVTTLCKAGLASVAYFYFDFRDVDKKSRRNLLPSLLVQLSTCSDACSGKLSHLYETHDNGARQASDRDLTQCLKDMLTLSDNGPVYLIMDALDECPNTSDIPSARKRVLDLVKDLVGLRLPNLRICITSRPEVDICDALESLASETVSLQNELGQKKDIADYVRSVVHSGSSTFMKRWREEDKEHVIKTLSEGADGMFRWVFCQLEMLQNCLPQNVRRILRDLPASLDETYERMLREISKVNPDQVYRLLQCLAVSTRPLRVEELAEVLALDFDAAEEGIPALNKDWRWDDERQGVLATCSSLIVVVELDGNSIDDDSIDYLRGTTHVVQFAHFSVKEFLTSDRLADIKEDISLFHIQLEPAHTVIAQSCLAILLQPDHDERTKSASPLSEYAAQHWVDHALVGNVSLRIEDGIRLLFDPAKLYFTTWLSLYNPDRKWPSFAWERYEQPSQSNFTSLGEDNAPLCLYYAALCGFHGLTKFLITKYPQHLNATVGLNMSPLVAALYSRHIQVAQLLHQRGAVLPIGANGCTLLHAASADGLVDVAQWLLVGADANAQDDDQRTSLHEASENGHVDIARLLIEHGADIHARDQNQLTPLHLTWHPETAQLLIKHGADVHARDQSQSTPLHLAQEAETAQVLIKHGADVHARDQRQSTPLHLTWDAETAQLLIKHGADVNARDQSQSTPLHLTWHAETAQLLIKHGADVNARDQSQSTPLHLAWNAETAQVLIKHGADVHARDQSQSTPLHLASSLFQWNGDLETPVRVLIEHGASVNAYDKNHQTPLHRVSSCDDPDVGSLRLLLENGANVDVEDDKGLTAFQIASAKGWRHREIAQLLLDHRARIVSNTID